MFYKRNDIGIAYMTIEDEMDLQKVLPRLVPKASDLQNLTLSTHWVYAEALAELGPLQVNFIQIISITICFSFLHIYFQVYLLLGKSGSIVFISQTPICKGYCVTVIW